MRLMISVLSLAEARQALAGGAGILDVKNPEEGSLGAPAPGTLREVCQLCRGRLEVSAAIGDLPDLPGTAALAALGAASCGADYVKVGLYGTRGEQDALRMLDEVRRAVCGSRASVVAAGYADYAEAGTLNPECLPRLAARAGVRGILIDTAAKDGRSLLDFASAQALGLLAAECHAAGLLFCLAGRLREQDLAALCAIGADVAGIRSEACRDGRRGGPLDPDRVRTLVRAAGSLPGGRDPDLA